MKSMKAMKGARAAPKGQIATELAESSGLKKSDVMSLLDSLATIGAKELKKAQGEPEYETVCCKLIGLVLQNCDLTTE